MPRFLPAALLLSLVLSACSSRYQAPVDEMGRFLDEGRTHRVNGGETLYAVAWMYDLDPGALARANNLREPYSIAPGQILSVDLRGAAAAPAANTAVAVATPVNPGVAIQRAPITSEPLTRQSLPGSTTPPQTAPPAATTTPPPTRTPQTTPQPTPQAVPPPAAATVPPPAQLPSAPPLDPNAPVVWDWPTRGTILARFSATGVDNKGLDLAGNEGDPILAAAAGEVVYAGGGLLRYGDLVILKHNDRYLSAYAHNSRIIVKEGDRITRGQKIAELGSSGIDRNMLHFEIRLDGKPVDPLRYLPAR
jgi:lipoprotein NlpD